MDDKELERAVDQEVEAQIELAREVKSYNYDDEVANAEDPCCDECKELGDGDWQW